MRHRQVFSISSLIVLLCLFIEIDGRPQRTTTERLIYGPDYDGDGIPDTPDYDNPIHRPDRTTAATTTRTRRTTTARLIYGPDYDGDGIPDLDMIDYDNPIHSKRNLKKKN